MYATKGQPYLFLKENSSFLVLLLITSIFLTIPAFFAFADSLGVIDLLQLVTSSLSLSFLVLVFAHHMEKRLSFLGILFFVLIITVILAIRFGYAILVDFSGKGFTDEFFFHLEAESFRVGWQNYHRLLTVLICLTALFLVGCSVLIRRSKLKTVRNGWILLVLALSFFHISRSKSPEIILYNAYQNYRGHSNPQLLDQTTLDRFYDLNLLHPVKRPKSELTVSLPDSPKNLILIYLESFNRGLTEHPDYPGLTPNLNRLQARYGSVHDSFASGFVTIEGIINSQCGTMVDMSRKNDSIM